MSKIIAFAIVVMLYTNTNLRSQYSSEDFIGTWNGTIESQWFEYSVETTLTFNNDGTYQESSGRLMPSIYPNTQTWEINSNNRLQLKYLSVVYAGQKTYQYFIYDIVKIDNNMIELHYNIHQEEMPEPDVQKIVLKKFTSSVENDKPSNKTLIRVLSPYGEELPLNTNGVTAIYLFDDGSILKQLIQK